MINLARINGSDIPAGPSAHIGRVIERITSGKFSHNIDDIDPMALNKAEFNAAFLSGVASDANIKTEQMLKNYMNHLCSRLFKMSRMVDRAYQRGHVLIQKGKYLAESNHRKISLLEQSLNRANNKISSLGPSNIHIGQEHLAILKQVVNLEDQQTISLLHQAMLDRIQDIFKDLSDAMIQITIKEKDIDISIQTPMSGSFLIGKERMGLYSMLTTNVDTAMKLYEHLSHLSRELTTFLQTVPRKTPEIELLSRSAQNKAQRLRIFQKLVAPTLDELPARCTAELRDAFIFAIDHMKQMLDHVFFRYNALQVESWSSEDIRAKSALPFHLPTADPEAHNSLDSVEQTTDALVILWSAAEKEDELMAIADGDSEWQARSTKREERGKDILGEQ